MICKFTVPLALPPRLDQQRAFQIISGSSTFQECLMGEAGGTQQNLLGGMSFNKIWFHLWSKKLNYEYETNYKMCISNTSA